MKLLVIILAFLNGGYMLIDGIFVMIKGKYIGPERPGPWANLFYTFDINVFKLGPLFVLFGLMWLAWLCGFWIKHEWAYAGGIALAILTLWYLPVGTLFSIIILVILIFAKQKLQL